ncbi:DUF1800 domain-containing protein [Acidisoma cladoniae]|uniref:DUF1800 domain-containing protein n=1 Tax=Acidisoma cladoniae TaxID=3040935 RepID=UPI00254CACF8|nr:DUF1800 domain-containing protein [Acidisoma sp. PAMC 29798]
MDTSATQAVIRFGLGQRGAEPLPANPQAWLSAQLTGPDPAQFAPTLPTVADGLILLHEQNKLHLPPGSSLVQPVLQEDMAAQAAELLTTAAPFRERLVWFWANHFTVSIRQSGTGAVVGPYVREAIRPNVTGPFFAMLLAVMRHPAMILYLENDASVGPNSPVGLRDHLGLNENLARECLELHTLSPAAGYSQQDVTEFAKILTGWTIDLKAAQPGFRFLEEAHEPGEKTLLGQTFPPGEVGGLMALDFLASHPATHRHLARQIAAHFVADDPAPDAVAAVEGALRDTRGNLGAAAGALITLPASWTPLTKFRTPMDYAVAALRLLDLPEDQRPPLPHVMAGLGQPLWNAPLPNGWSDQASDWAAPDAMMRRIDWSYGIAGHLGAQDPMVLADAALGPLLRPATTDQMRHAGSRRDALTLLFSSPEFQRR